MKRFKRTEQNDILITDHNPSKYKIGFFGANTQFSFTINWQNRKMLWNYWGKSYWIYGSNVFKTEFTEMPEIEDNSFQLTDDDLNI